MTFGEKVIGFHRQLEYNGNALPKGIRIMNPFTESTAALANIKLFAKKYQNDVNPRHLILGINPSRLGAGITGIPFTDTKRLISECNIPYHGKSTHEISSVFIYEMIKAFGGVESFYKTFYINSPFPLAITQITREGRHKNYNYYDSPALLRSVKSFMIESVQRLIKLGIKTEVCFCLGTGKNAKFLNELNSEHKFFGKIVALEHPRFIMQYKSATKQMFIDKYITELASVLH
jgi:Domain of unknown function (DUF4918)